MSKHILEKDRAGSDSARSARYFQIEAAKRPHLQSKVLQRQTRLTEPLSRVKRFLEIDRNRKDAL